MKYRIIDNEISTRSCIYDDKVYDHLGEAKKEMENMWVHMTESEQNKCDAMYIEDEDNRIIAIQKWYKKRR